MKIFVSKLVSYQAFFKGKHFGWFRIEKLLNFVWIGLVQFHVRRLTILLSVHWSFSSLMSSFLIIYFNFYIFRFRMLISLCYNNIIEKSILFRLSYFSLRLNWLATIITKNRVTLLEFLILIKTMNLLICSYLFFILFINRVFSWCLCLLFCF
jgi:hypothetical protein